TRRPQQEGARARRRRPVDLAPRSPRAGHTRDPPARIPPADLAAIPRAALWSVGRRAPEDRRRNPRPAAGTLQDVRRRAAVADHALRDRTVAHAAPQGGTVGRDREPRSGGPPRRVDAGPPL